MTSATPTPAGTGRPRDRRIDDAVLQATTELLEEVGYLQLTIGAIADRAGTNKPAIYRRWPTKAHLVHEAVFPIQDPATLSLGGDGGDGDGNGDADGDLRGDVRAAVAVGVELLGRPAARAALPGLLAEMTTDPTLQADVLDRFAGASWGWLQRRIEGAIEAGEVRPGVRSSTVLELIAGSTLVTTLIRPLDQIDAAWVDDVTDVIMRGIAR